MREELERQDEKKQVDVRRKERFLHMCTLESGIECDTNLTICIEVCFGVLICDVWARWYLSCHLGVQLSRMTYKCP